ncbi:transmembrane sensor [Parabacteroides sp. PF5-5]|uniref:FecR family protein n=1 Tax=unclassified Parabacteroides TaxID=2649774 RepID=UPI002476FA34|nr:MULTISPECIES: FecR domain-containing protein [unclassified Parabacteroides]MDH6304921.1 transmembrane sensor [Parabacteroides sp. PH5-39]MDH6315993.1 transmembrane sensor [Parabacteroides sp. PF5-13]MDH6319650.1 transmembrane sensor [Parabacteroides sp. PH5-13]MDH6323381.1 transmembrane sensor [Parabacteroides sp. PH5-8]MDH6327110.1 transmembrane sensor [Parabacteroides sp. PH5-41]
MLEIGKNNIPGWELLLNVLSGEVSENDPSFQRWLEEDGENRKLYLQLKGKEKIATLAFDKEKAFNNMSDILGLNNRKKVPFYQQNWLRYTASFLAIIFVGLAGYFLVINNSVPEQIEYAEIENNVLDPGTKKAFLLSSQGKVINLSESFELKNTDGTIISNKSEGVVSFKPTKLQEKKVEQHTIYVPKGGEYELLLADGSKVFLNSETHLVFPSHFNDDVRQVELTGEAYFEVQKQEKPFIVKTPVMDIEVLGTSFNVNAYQENLSVHTTLVEGSVQVHLPDDMETYLLEPENNLTINKASRKISIRKVNTDLYTAWVKGELVFRNQPLGEIFTQLQRWYDFEITYKDPAIQSMRFSGSIEKVRSLDYFLNQIQSVTNVKYKNEGEDIILY